MAHNPATDCNQTPVLMTESEMRKALIAAYGLDWKNEPYDDLLPAFQFMRKYILNAEKIREMAKAETRILA